MNRRKFILKGGVLVPMAFAMPAMAQAQLLKKKTSIGSIPIQSSAFSPASISGLQFWYKSDAGAFNDAGSTLATNGQTVQQWNDQSGNSRNLTQATSGKRAIYNTNQLNNLPGILFDGTDDFFSVSGTNIMSVTSGSTSTWFVVAKPLIDSQLLALCAQSTTTWGIVGVNLDVYDGSNESFRLWDLLTTVAHRGIATRAGTGGTDVNVYVTGSSVGQVQGAIGNASTGNFFVGIRSDGTSWAMNGYIYEIGGYNSVLSAGNLTLLNTYLNTRWGV